MQQKTAEQKQWWTQKERQKTQVRKIANENWEKEEKNVKKAY